VSDFKLPSVDGSWVQLSKYKGKKSVLLYFWATWCPACIEIKPQVMQLREKIAEEKLEILAINVGTADSFNRVKKFQKGHPVPWPVLYDKEGQIASSYGVQGIPLFILVNKAGETVYRGHEPPRNPKRYF
jgi:peroxiredoxin